MIRGTHPRVETGEFKYKAFISYSRADGRWARLLQARLETYVLPKALRRIKPGVQLDRRPLRPIFRDIDELVPGPDLAARIRARLAESEYLIVLCSPRAAQSAWVDKEIRAFIELGGSLRILAVVVAGTPYAASKGQDASLEALPAALRFQVDLRHANDGSPVAVLTNRHTEPFWVAWWRRRDRPTLLRLVAAMLSLASLDALVQRDRQRQRRRLLLGWALAAAVALSFLGLGLALIFRGQAESVRKAQVLVRMAEEAGQREQWESSARYALLAMKHGRQALVSFETRAAENALLGALLHNRELDVLGTLDYGPNARTLLAPDGTLLATATPDGVVQLRDTLTGKSTSVQTGAILALRLSPDGTLLATRSDGQYGERAHLRIWDVATGKPVFKAFEVDAPLLQDFQFSSDNRYLGILEKFMDGGGDLLLVTLPYVTVAEVVTFHSGIESFAFSADGSLVAASWEEGTRVWNTAERRPVTSLLAIGGSAPKTALALAPNNEMLAAGTADGGLIFWNLKEGREVQNTTLSAGKISTLKFSSDGRHLGVGHAKGPVHVWEGNEPGSYASRGALFHPGGWFAFLPDGRRMVTLDAEKSVRLWKLSGYDTRARIPQHQAAAFSPDGRRLALVESDVLSSVDTQTLRRTVLVPKFAGASLLNQHSASLAVSPDGRLIARESQESLWLVDAERGDHWRLPGKSSPRGALAFAPDGKTLASVAAKSDQQGDVSTQLWDTTSRLAIGAAVRAPHAVSALAFSPDGTRLALGSESGGVTLWDVARGAELLPAPPASGKIVAFVGAGRYLLAGPALAAERPRSQLQVWNLATGAPEGPPINSELNEVRQVVLLADPTRVLLVGWQAVVFWDLLAGKQIGVALEVSEIIETAMVSPDGDKLFVATGSYISTPGSSGPNYPHLVRS